LGSRAPFIRVGRCRTEISRPADIGNLTVRSDLTGGGDLFGDDGHVGAIGECVRYEERILFDLLHIAVVEIRRIPLFNDVVQVRGIDMGVERELGRDGRIGEPVFEVSF
jgi:hypothetical protein